MALSSQAAWEAQKRIKDELEARIKMNQTILYHFDDNCERKQTEKKQVLADKTLPILSPFGDQTAVQSPSERSKGGTLSAYDMKRKGLVRSGTWGIDLQAVKWPELPGGVGVRARPTRNWDQSTRECPVIATRYVLKAGRHIYRVQMVPVERDMLLATHGEIKVGFFDSDEDSKESWSTPHKIGKAWYYRSMGNIYNGSSVARDHQAPGLQPLDIITCSVNFNDQTGAFSLHPHRGSTDGRGMQSPMHKATFSKKRAFATVEREYESISDDYTIEGVTAQNLRFGVQFERECPGVILRDYVDGTEEDALYRGKGFKGYGLMHVQRREYAEAVRCFKKAHGFFHIAGDRILRKEAGEMRAEAEVLRDTGIETPGNAIFRMIGEAPIKPMVAGFAEVDTQEEEGEEGQEGTSKTPGQMESAQKLPTAEEV